MPYRPHSAYPSPYAATATAHRRRPSAAWFGVGGALLLVAVTFFVIGMFRTVHLFSSVDATFPASGTHHVTLPAHTKRALFVESQGRFHCRAHEGSGAAVHFVKPGTGEEGSWVWEDSFDTGDGSLTFVCDAGRHAHPALVRVVPVPSGGQLLELGLGGILLPMVLGGLGFVVLLVTTVLWFSRGPRSAPPGALPGWRPPGPPNG